MRAITAILLSSMGAGSALATEAALPDEGLHGVKTATEQMRLGLARSPEQKVAVLLDIADARLREAVLLDSFARHTEAGVAVSAYGEHVARAAAQLQDSPAAADPVAVDRFRAEVAKQQTNVQPGRAVAGAPGEALGFVTEMNSIFASAGAPEPHQIAAAAANAAQKASASIQVSAVQAVATVPVARANVVPSTVPPALPETVAVRRGGRAAPATPDRVATLEPAATVIPSAIATPATPDPAATLEPAAKMTSPSPIATTPGLLASTVATPVTSVPSVTPVRPATTATTATTATAEPAAVSAGGASITRARNDAPSSAAAGNAASTPSATPLVSAPTPVTLGVAAPPAPSVPAAPPAAPPAASPVDDQAKKKGETAAKAARESAERAQGAADQAKRAAEKNAGKAPQSKSK